MTKVVDLFQTQDSAAACMHLFVSRASRMSLHFLCRFPNHITVQSIQPYDRIFFGTVVDNLCARGGAGKREAMLPSLIYIEWS